MKSFRLRKYNREHSKGRSCYNDGWCIVWDEPCYAQDDPCIFSDEWCGPSGDYGCIQIDTCGPENDTQGCYFTEDYKIVALQGR